MRKADMGIHRHRCEGHVYTDPDPQGYDGRAAEVTSAVALDFLARLDAD
ncbi:hypothetical protein IAG44_01245 [Streptomyces roseirectus]|uniref:Uncharacterized protein n=1 Tax=Streptomyces roseirectus TaxID=2768066 RepID=A0A7H0I610_9ACTN|nr:hypothetical protein [Streptomyces roseirectus]QNP68226.1 hypothetical protein IAG44_01245 [Streptomyces roseirectus]